MYTFDFSFLNAFWDSLLDGAWTTIQISVGCLILGFVLGVILAVARRSSSVVIKRLAGGFVDLTRNTPLIVQTFWLFFGLAALGIQISAFYTAIIALSINTSGYTCEIVRAGIDTIYHGQREAAECLGLSRWQILRSVILPQAIEKMFPSLMSQFVLMMLGTSIMSQISVEELTAVGLQIQSQTFRGFEAYLVIAGIYLVLSWLLRLSMALCYNIAFPRRRKVEASLFVAHQGAAS
ncbi:MAG TPA: amino acid ABC transporter permease [Castellaniella sp.]|uniref:amino acid ABC transporter permease n=1 Tax=Castellaniella sp. TaxID=1955812 RepID=UPI002F108921